MSIVILCGNGGMVPVKGVCHMVVPLPSRTLLAAYVVAEASLSADAVQPTRDRAGRRAGFPSRPSSAANEKAPRLPASVRAVSRTNRADTPPNTAVFRVLSSAQVPVTTALQFVPSLLTEIEYRPISPV